LSELVIPDEEWTKWWQSARTKVKKDAMIATPENARGHFEIRDAEETPEDRLHMALEKKPTTDELIHLIYNFLRDFPTSLRNVEFRKLLFERLSDVIATSELTDAQEVQLHFFLEDLSGDNKYTGANDMIKRLPSVQGVVDKIDIVAFKKRVLQGVRKTRDDWAELFLDLLLPTTASSLRDFMMQELIGNGHEEGFVKKIEDLIAHPMHYPTALLWYFKHVMQKNTIPLANQEGRNRLFEALFILLSDLESDLAANRDMVKKIHLLISNGRFANVRKVFQDCDIETVQEFLLLATKCHTFEQHDQKIFHSLASVVHPSLSALRKDDDEEEEEVIWTTEAGFNKTKAHLEHIATVETVKNAKEIEIARSHGDLRENAEFKAAQERRRTLQGEIKTLSALLKKARVLTKDEIDTAHVGVGTIVTGASDDGTEITITLLGPWDVDIDNNILSFQSKLAITMEGLTVGEKFMMHHTEYTIKKIESFL
ncbi:MAG: GreA/GreB family elongation factor, partial [Simkaniaceae bacterium]|nr:GreA/GreB family elongation factor [Simkaniaceae bacterium]